MTAMTTDAIASQGELTARIKDALAPLRPAKVILFGSHAWGQASADSDIDLYVVTQDDSMPAGYEERMRNHLEVAAALRELNKEVAIDLIVHTKPMHETFVRLDSTFAREIMGRGQVLYERDR